MIELITTLTVVRLSARLAITFNNTSNTVSRNFRSYGKTFSVENFYKQVNTIIS